MTATYLTFGLYLLFMIGVGAYFMRRSDARLGDYALGGRGLGSWVTAFSAQASDMSGWLLMGLPGAIYMLQFQGSWGDIWCALGLALGTWANWVLIAPRLRLYSEKTRSLTLTAFLERRFHDPSGVISVLSVLITLTFFIVYAASGLSAVGKLFNSMFDLDYQWAVLIGAAVILTYTFMGGYLAVCWTDLIQGVLMFGALIVVPISLTFRIRRLTLAPNWHSAISSVFPMV